MGAIRLISFGPLIACAACVICSMLAAAPAAGPLRVHPDNPRYFTDGTKAQDGTLRAFYLTGAHTWNNLVDMGRADPPEAFDFEGYLKFLERHHHNFIRLWTWDTTVWDTRGNGAASSITPLLAASRMSSDQGPLRRKPWWRFW